MLIAQQTEARLVRLDAKQLERLREKVAAKNGVVIYRKPDWLHAAYEEGITEEDALVTPSPSVSSQSSGQAPQGDRAGPT